MGGIPHIETKVSSHISYFIVIMLQVASHLFFKKFTSKNRLLFTPKLTPKQKKVQNTEMLKYILKKYKEIFIITIK